jgi:hypothetical protein
MDIQFLSGLFLLIGIFSLFISGTIIIQFIRGLIKKHENNKVVCGFLLVLLVSEYILLLSLFYIQITAPFSVTFDGSPGGQSLGINPTINYLLTITFLCISITAFRHTLPYFKSNSKSFLFLNIIGIILIYLISNASKHDYDQFSDSKTISQLVSIRSSIAPPIILLFIVTLFRINKQQLTKTILYTFIPIIAFYFILIYSRVNINSLPNETKEYYMNKLGAYG